jgi:hypothetical protein
MGLQDLRGYAESAWLCGSGVPGVPGMSVRCSHRCSHDIERGRAPRRPKLTLIQGGQDARRASQKVGGRPRGGALLDRTRHLLRLRAENGSERSVVVRVPVPVPGAGPAAGVALTISQLPGNVAGPGTKIWRHSPVVGLTTENGNAGATNVSRAPHATTSAAIFFRIELLLPRRSSRPRMRSPAGAARLRIAKRRRTKV